MSLACPVARTFLPWCFSLALIAGCNGDTVTQKLAIGSACTTSSDCGSEPHFFCDRDHESGYCKKDCKSDADCPSEAICAFDGGVGACHKKCNVSDSDAGRPTDCRFSEGYVCQPSSAVMATLASHSYCDAPAARPDGGAVLDMSHPVDGAPGG